MFKKSVIAAIALICVGIIFGVVLVSSYNGIKWSFAGDTKIGAANAPLGNETLKSMSDGYIAIAKEINPKVVSIVVTTKPEKADNRMNDLFRFFGEEPDGLQERQSQGSGSGVIISADGYILTNNHVVKDADKAGISVTTYDRKTFNAKVVGTDKNTDLAVIKVDASDLPVAFLGNSDNVQVGEVVVAAGNPLGLNSTITHGIVSALGRNIGILAENRTSGNNFSIENFIQTDAVINPGNSGGPLVDVNGAVIGINSAIASGTGYYTGYAFAIPINLAKKVADDIIKFGKVKRGFLGISMDMKSIDETWAKALGLPKAAGVMVQGVTAGGAAENAGIQAGDVILEVEGKEVNSPNQLQDIVGRKHPGDEVKLKFFRDGKSFEKTMKLREMNDDNATLADNPKSGDNNEDNAKSKTTVSFTDLGFSVRNLTSADKSRLKISEGILVESVKNYGYAQSRTLQTNTVITEIMRKGKTTKTNNVGDLEQVIKECKPGEAVMLKVKAGTNSRFIALEIPKE